MKSNALYLDIETGPVSADQLARIMPEFEPDSRLKDPVKIAASIWEKKQDWLDKAALRATTGRVLAVTTAIGDAEPIVDTTEDEKTLLDRVIGAIYGHCCCEGNTLYTWNGNGFDLPFICQRAAVHGIKAFRMLSTNRHGRWSWNEYFVDAMQVWAMYTRTDGCGLDAVARALGVGEKSGHGADFAATLITDPAKAIEYAANDVRLLRSIVQRMGLDGGRSPTTQPVMGDDIIP